MNNHQYKIKYGLVFTFCMCLVLMLVVFTTGAWLNSSAKTSGDISMAELDVILLNIDPNEIGTNDSIASHDITGQQSIDLGETEFGSNPRFMDTGLYVYNNADASAYIRIHVECSYVDYVSFATPEDDYQWIQSGNYYYLCDLDDNLLSIASEEYVMFADYLSVDEIEDMSSDTITFYIGLDAIQSENISTSQLVAAGWEI